MNSTNKRFFILSILLIFSISTMFGQTFRKDSSNVNDFSRSGAAMLATGKAVHAIGETAVIYGSGFSPYEEINITVNQIDDQLREEVLRGTWTIFADGKGKFISNWEVSSRAKFTVKATGSESGARTETVIAASVTPIVLSGNPSCATLNASANPAFAHITTNFGFKLDANPPTGNYPLTNGGIRELTGGAAPEPGNSINYTKINDNNFDFSSTRLISAVIVKAGADSNVYPYNPTTLGDTNLVTNDTNAISHVEFCFGPPSATITIIKDAAPNSTQSFDFKANGQVVQDFALVDNGVVGPDRIQFTNLTGTGAGNTVTVSEGPSAPYSLTNISCTSDNANNNTVNVPARFVEIFLEPGENVVCTFTNSIVTAAGVSVSGKITDAYGNPLSRASVTIQNLSSGEIQTVSTGSFGYYRFEELPSGDSYMVTVSHRRHTFSNNSQVFSLGDAIEDLDFKADLQ